MSNIPYYKIGIVVVLLHLFAVCAAYGGRMQVGVGGDAQDEKSSAPVALRFESLSWNFGDIAEDGGDVEHTFRFSNVSKSPVVVLDVSASCGCTSPSFSRKPVLPNKSGEIKVRFSPMNRPGKFSKGVVVQLSNQQRITLTIEGNVLPRVLTAEEIYPFEVGEGVRLSANFHAFSYIGRGEEAEEVVVLYNDSDNDATFGLRPRRSSGMLRVKAPEIVKAHSTATITLGYKIAKESDYYGAMDDVLNIVVNGKESRTLLSTHAIAVDKYNPAIDDMLVPSCELSKKIIKFGDVKHGKTAEDSTIEIHNDSEADLLVRAVEWRSSALQCSLKAGDRIAAGASCRVTFTLDTSECDYGVWVERVSIITNDVERPMQSVRVTAIVVD